MTGEDHNDDAVIAALTSPALPSERAGESAAVAAMLDALPANPAKPAGRRSRRGVAVAAVTVASLGVGGLVAAGPGAFFLPAADRSPTASPETTIDSNAPLSTLASDRDERIPGPDTTALPSTSLVETPPSPAGPAPASDGDETGPGDADACEGTHGDVVSDVARSTVPGDDVRDIARSDCGKPDASDGVSPSATAPGQTGDTPATTAPGRTGDTPATTAPGRTGDTPATTAPGRTGDTPATTAPGQTGDAGNEDRGTSDDRLP